MGLPKYGVTAVVENLPAFNKAIDTINNKIEAGGKTIEGTTKKLNPFAKALDNAQIGIGRFHVGIKDLLGTMGPAGDAISGVIDKIAAIPLPVAAAALGVAALGKVFLDLGARGAPLQEIGRAFDNLTASIGLTSQALLKDLRAASEGTIADFDLIKTASTALLGVGGDFGKVFGQSLPQFLKIAKVEADATGRSVNELFNNLVEGVKKGTPKLIENTGLIIDQKAAYQDYAKTLGITVAQMNDTDRSMALLNATLDAGAIAINTLGSAAESNADKQERLQATLTNIADSLAIAVQPAFGVLLDSVQNVLNIFQQLALAVAPIFGSILSVITSVISTIVSVVTSIAQPFIDAFSSVAPYIALVFQTVGNIIAGAGKIISDVVSGIVKFLSDVGKQFFGLDLKNLGPQLFNGAAAAFGSFANGIIAVANKLIFPAVIAIAKFIADFLIGFSPPKEGPLSQIDKGGANVMTAWLEGFSGVSLDPVKQVADEVSKALGKIGTESLRKVNARLAELDKALLPFQNRLDIIKAQFDALNEPAKQALDAIDRQSQALQDAVAQGDPAAAERLRQLDMARDAIQGQVDAQQSLVDRAQIQLALAKAQQAPERALLTIRQAYLNALAKAAPKTTGAGAGATPTPKGAGAGTVTPSVGGTVPTITPGTTPSVLDLIGGQGAVDAAAQGLSDAFMGAIDQSGLQDFAQNELNLGTQIDRIKSIDLGSKIANKFKSLTDAFNPDVEGSPANAIHNFVQTLTGDENTPGSVASFFVNMGTNLQNAAANIAAGIQTFVSSIFDPNIEGSPFNVIKVTVATLTGDSTIPGSLANMFASLPANIANAASSLFNTLKIAVFDPVTNFLVGTGEGSISDILQQVVDFFGGLPARIVDIMKGLGANIYIAVVIPVVNAINSLIELVENALKGFMGSIADFLQGIANTLGALTPQFLIDAINSLRGAQASIRFGRLSTALPSFLQSTLGGKLGGEFGPGLVKVGESGPEYIYNAIKTGIIPAQLTSVLTDLSQILAQPQPMPVMAGNSYQDSHNMSMVFNGVQGSQDVMRRFASMRARS